MTPPKHATLRRNYSPASSFKKLNVLVVLAHPDTEESFNAAIRNKVLEALEDAGHDSRILSIGDDSFDPRLSKTEHDKMYSKPGFSKDLTRHIEALHWANSIIFIYPTWWSNVPAALKGWIDRVFIPGVAYAPPGKSDESIRPLLNFTKTVVITTTGGPAGQDPDLGEIFLTETIPRGCYVSSKHDILVYKIHDVGPNASHLGSELARVYDLILNF